MKAGEWIPSRPIGPSSEVLLLLMLLLLSLSTSSDWNPGLEMRCYFYSHVLVADVTELWESLAVLMN